MSARKITVTYDPKPIPLRQFDWCATLDHYEPDSAEDALLVARLTEELRMQIQQLVDVGLADRQSVWA